MKLNFKKAGNFKKFNFKKRIKGEKKKISLKDVKEAFKTKSFRIGGYSIAATAIVIAIAVFVNVFANALPTSITQLDMTSSQIYSFSEDTENLLADLEEDITIYWIVQEGQEDITLEHLLDRYESTTDKIDVVKRDPDVYPTFLTQYDITDTYNNSLIVESGDTFRYVSYEDIYQYDYSSYYYDYSYDTSFAGENAVTSAIDYVISDDLPKMYMLTGHGESELSSTFSGAVQSANVDYEQLSLLTEGAIPEDADAIMIYAPQSDISEEEQELLSEYMNNGGNLFVITDPTEEGELSNLEALMEGYGVTTQDGIVIEGNQNYYLMGTPYYLLPEMSSHEITQTLADSGYYVLLSVAQGLEVASNLPEDVSVSELLTTTDSSYSKIAGYSLTTYDKEDGDIDGPFALAVAITDTIDDETESKIVWVTSSSLADDTTNQRVSGGNQDFFINSLNWLCDREDGISIHAKSINYEYLTISSGSSSMLIALMIGVIPVAFLGCGIYTWVRRKRR